MDAGLATTPTRRPARRPEATSLVEPRTTGTPGIIRAGVAAAARRRLDGMSVGGPATRAAVVLLLAAYLVPLAWRAPLMDEDEGLHAAIAQEMVERGDWTTPRLL